MRDVDRLLVASEAAFVLEKMGFVACGRKKDGVVSVDVWWQQPKGTSFIRYEVDRDDYTAETLAAACAATVSLTERSAKGRRSDPGTDD
jgi:hypothetical protein